MIGDYFVPDMEMDAMSIAHCGFIQIFWARPSRWRLWSYRRWRKNTNLMLHAAQYLMDQVAKKIDEEAA